MGMKAEEGTGTFFKGLKPLWLRQIPYTMMKFACFEKTVVALYQYVVPKPRDQCSKSEPLMVTFAAGYIAGVFCAIVSHPADNVVSVINKNPGKTAGEIFKEMGLWNACTKGLPARIIMIGTLTALQWFIYDGVKVPAPSTTTTTTDARVSPPQARGTKQIDSHLVHFYLNSSLINCRHYSVPVSLYLSPNPI